MSKYRRPEGMAPPVDWQRKSIELHARLVQAESERDLALAQVEVYREIFARQNVPGENRK